MVIRTTVIVDGLLALRMARVAAARASAIGREILTLPLLAARLAGGFTAPAGTDVLYPAIKTALEEGGFSDLTDVAGLPGMPRAVLATLSAAWSAVLSLAASDPPSKRLADLHLIEARIRTKLPTGRLLPSDLRDAALQRLRHAPALFGRIAIEGVLDIDRVWQPLLRALAAVVPMRWILPGSEAPAWFSGEVRFRALAKPLRMKAQQCADPRSEVVEALRWARQLLSSGSAMADQIAIAATSPAIWDEHFLVLARNAELPLHFSHGVPALSTREGQVCAALADILTKGLNQDRVRRLFYALPPSGTYEAIPSDWSKGLPRKAALRTLEHWQRALALARPKREDGEADEVSILGILALLAKGPAAADEAGNLLLVGSSRLLWDEALRSAPSHAVGLALENLRVADGLDPGNSIVWCPAAQLAARPRPWTRLIGLTSLSWPRAEDDDPLIPDHILPRERLRTTSLPESDRRHFEVIAGLTAQELVLSRGQRSANGSLQSASALWPEGEEVLRRNRIPQHAFSESDRLLARPADAGRSPRVAASQACWRDWHKDTLTGHDGVVTASHPAIETALGRVLPATSIERLLRDPLGFVWRHALGWQSLHPEEEPLELDAGTFGELVHELISRTVNAMGPASGFAAASGAGIEAALGAATLAVEAEWPLERSVPPPLLWRHLMREAAARAARGLAAGDPLPAGTGVWTEVRFGEAAAPQAPSPWDAIQPGRLGAAALAFSGRIDRLDVRATRDGAAITDYKSGKPPEKVRRVTLGRGRELQRVLYAIAVKQLLPEVKHVAARLVYLAGEAAIFTLENDELEAAIRDAETYVVAALAIVRSGRIAPRPEPDEGYDDMRLALPADREAYLRRKQRAIADAHQSLARLWGKP